MWTPGGFGPPAPFISAPHSTVDLNEGAQLNLKSLIDRVRHLTGIKLSEIREDEQIKTVLNEAYQEVLELYNWPFLRGEETVTVDAGDDEFTTPSEFSEVNSVSYDGSAARVRMSFTTIDEIDRLDQDADGDPTFYARLDGSRFAIWPKPSSSITVTVRGKISSPNLTTPLSTPVLPEKFRVIIAYRAAAKILAEEGDDSGRIAAYQSEANDVFKRMQQFYIRSADSAMFVMGSDRRRRNLDAYRGRPTGRL